MSYDGAKEQIHQPRESAIKKGSIGFAGHTTKEIEVRRFSIMKTLYDSL